MSADNSTAELLRLLELKDKLERRTRIERFYPDVDDLPLFPRRALYPKHMSFFAAGATRRERAFIAGNRVGKSEGVGCFELVCHLRNIYPAWWKGRRFNRPIQAWCAGDTGKTTREILQRILLGPVGNFGTGLIPAADLVRTTAKPGIADAVEGIFVKANGGVSELLLKSFDQRREAFQGSNIDCILLDEECERDIYVECLLRTMTTGGLVMCTFTPLQGFTEIVRDFLAEQDKDSGKFCIQASWSDVPHLSAEAKAELEASIPPYQLQARMHGVPQLGAGKIYLLPETDLIVPDFAIPPYYDRAYALDPGWNRTAVIWGARDNETGVIYLYSEHYAGQAEPILHAQAIKGRGAWIPGVIDPAARGRSLVDGRRLISVFRECGLNLTEAENSVEAGIWDVWQLMTSGKLKVFQSLGNWLSEFRMYRRDNDGKIVKENDHLMDAMRYLIMSGRDRMQTKPPAERIPHYSYDFAKNMGQSWMQ